MLANMKARRHLSLAGGVSAFLMCAAATPTPTPSSPASGDRGLAVVHVGPRSVSVQELRARLALVPSVQKRALGATDDERRERFVNEIIVPDALFALEAGRIHLAEQPAVRARLNGVLRDALVLEFGHELERARAVTEVEIERYFDEHRDEFSVPKRLHAWWIVVDSAELARTILSETQGVAGLRRWTELARRHSTDRATRMRSGDLGFVDATGQSSIPSVRVPPEVYSAAEAVADGAVVPKPVEVSGRFAVVWRRGSSPARDVEPKDVKLRIGRALLERRVQEQVQTKLQELRRQHVRDLRVSLLSELPGSDPSSTTQR
jgi:hypothetical protein